MTRGTVRWLKPQRVSTVVSPLESSSASRLTGCFGRSGLITKVLEEDGHRVFFAVCEYFPVKLVYCETRRQAKPLGLWS